MEKVTKQSVNYRPADTFRHCGNCVMFQGDSCDLVMGLICSEDVCDRWEAPVGKSQQTPELSVTHAPIGHEGVWHSKNPPLQLPAYIQNIRNALMRNGHDEQSAHALAVAAVKRWASGKGHVHPEVREASRKAVAEWEALRADHP